MSLSYYDLHFLGWFSAFRATDRRRPATSAAQNATSRNMSATGGHSMVTGYHHSGQSAKAASAADMKQPISDCRFMSRDG